MKGLSDVVRDAGIYGLELDARTKVQQISIGKLQMIFKSVAALKPDIISFLLEDVSLLWRDFKEFKRIKIICVSPYEGVDIDQIEDLLEAFCVDEYPEVLNSFQFDFELNDGRRPIVSRGIALYVKKDSNPDIPICCTDLELEFFDELVETFSDEVINISKDAFDRKRKIFFMHPVKEGVSLLELSDEIKELGSSLGLKVTNLAYDKGWSNINFILSSKPIDKMYNLPFIKY